MALPPAKPPPPAPPGQEQVITRTPKFEIATRRKGNWLIVILRGNYSDEMVDTLKKEVFIQKVSYAVDTSLLSGIQMLLARELWFLASNLKNGGDTRLVLLNPPEKMRSLFGLITQGGKLTSFQGEEELPADGKNLEQHMLRIDQEMADLKKQISTNALWQFIDRESSWLCPFCGKMQDDIKIVSRVSVPPHIVEKVYRHIHHRCPSYSPVNPRFKPSAELEATIKRVSEDKFAASKQNAEKLEKKVIELDAKAQWAQSMEAGLKIAVDRQKRLLPARPPEIPGFEIAIVYRPASHVSGDFYDFIDMGEGRVGFTIGDVAGHGIEAGILMGMTKKVLNIRASDNPDPIEVMRKANVDIYKELDRQTFVTAFLGVLDPASKSFTYARAGHNPPLLFNKVRIPAHKKLEAGGLMLGMSTGTLFDRAMAGESFPLQSGDVILLYTDGLEESKNDQSELFGTQRMADILEKEGTRPASFILGALSFELDRFIGAIPVEDDITMVCIKAL